MTQSHLCLRQIRIRRFRCRFRTTRRRHPEALLRLRCRRRLRPVATVHRRPDRPWEGRPLEARRALAGVGPCLSLEGGFCYGIIAYCTKQLCPTWRAHETHRPAGKESVRRRREVGVSEVMVGLVVKVPELVPDQGEAPAAAFPGEESPAGDHPVRHLLHPALLAALVLEPHLCEEESFEYVQS